MNKARLYLPLILLVAAAAAAILLLVPRPLAGRLSFDPAATDLQPATFSAEGFRIAWNPAGGGQVRIWHSANPGRILWQSLPGQSFVQAAQGAETVTERRSMFTIKDRRMLACGDQRIDGLTQMPQGLVIRGLLTCGRAQSAQQINYRLEFSANGTPQPYGDRLTFRLSTAGAGAINRLFLTYASEADEHFYGFGEQFTYFNLKGRRVPIFASEQGIGRGAQPITLGANLTAGAGGDWSTTYAPLPHYLTSKLRSLFLETTAYSAFDLTAPDRVQIEAWTSDLTGQILSGETPAALIRVYTDATGRMRSLPDWVGRGAIVGIQGGTARVRQVWQQLQDHHTPIAAFWLQDWVGQRETSFGKQLWWNWELDRQRYPDWEPLAADLRAADIRILLYASPFLADVSAKQPVAMRNLFKEAAERGFLVKAAGGTPYLIRNTDFSAGLLDLTNPAAVAWFQQVLRDNLVAIGASGWMADFGEGLPYAARLNRGQASDFHNAYPAAWAQLNAQALEAAGLGQDGLFFTRSGGLRSPGATWLQWEGDQLVSWDRNDGIKTAVTGLLSSGVSGFAFNHSDIGGYTAIRNPLKNYFRSKELLLRWMELSAFTAVYRTHEGNLPDQNAQFFDDEESLAAFARFAQIYAALGDYRAGLAREAGETGLPVVRALFLQYPDDPKTWDLKNEFLLGPDVLAAPVLDPGRTEQRVYLPAGRWVHVWSGEAYPGGGYVTVPAPIGRPPVFTREGSPVGGVLVKFR